MLHSTPVRTLSHYFVARYLTLFAAFLLGSTLTITVVELLLNYDDMLEQGSGYSGALTYVFLRIPSYYLRDLIPISAFAASFSAIGLGVRWLEITAIKAGGISPLRIALPILASSLALSAATHLVGESLVIPATRGWNEQQQAEDSELVFRRGAFWYHSGRSIYNIMSADSETNTLRGVEIFRRTERGRLEQNIWADEVHVLPDGTWHMERANVRHFDPEHPAKETRVEIGIPLDLQVGKDRDLLLRQTDAASLSLPALAEYLDRHTDDQHSGSRANRRRLHALLHHRISEPMLVVLFTLLAMPLAFRVTPGSSLAPASIFAIVTLSAFFLLRSLAGSLADEGLLSGPVAVWTLISAFALWGSFGLARATR
jgi:LPS export ABC transporter permease LptG